MKNRTLLPLLAALALSACTSPYGQDFLFGGYRDKKIDDSTYVVSFSGNGNTSKDQVWYYWIYRCAELTSQKGYGYFTLEQNEKSASMGREGGMVPAVSRPHEGELIQVKGGGAPIYYYVPGGTTTRWSSNATVHMYPGPLPAGQLWGFSAKSVLEQLKPYVDSRGAVAPPVRTDVLKRAARTRDLIVIGDPIKTASTSRAFADGTAPPGFQPRSAESLRAGFDFPDVLLMQIAYGEYSKRTLDDLGGNVVVSFLVSSNGTVREPRIVSSTIDNRYFLEGVLEAMRRANFGGSNVVETRVSQFPIMFAPRAD